MQGILQRRDERVQTICSERASNLSKGKYSFLSNHILQVADNIMSELTWHMAMQD